MLQVDFFQTSALGSLIANNGGVGRLQPSASSGFFGRGLPVAASGNFWGTLAGYKIIAVNVLL